MWVLDGDGDEWQPAAWPDPSHPWRPIPSSPTGDRHAGSIVSRSHPDLYTCLHCAKDQQHKPGYVLSSSPSVQKRLMCAMHYDLGSKRFKCPDKLGWSDRCRPGCPTDWCEGTRFWECGYKPTALMSMLKTHDSMGFGHVENTKYNGYNELVLDSVKYPWEDELSDMVEAVFVQAGSPPSAYSYARLAHMALVHQLNQTALIKTGEGLPLEEVPPLLEYDALQKTTPFTVLEPGDIQPMGCSPAAGECWRRSCGAAVFQIGKARAKNNVGGIGLGAEESDDVTYEELDLMMAAKDSDRKGGKECK